MCESRAAFGNPVVPEVKMKKRSAPAVSPSRTAISGLPVGARARAMRPSRRSGRRLRGGRARVALARDVDGKAGRCAAVSRLSIAARHSLPAITSFGGRGRERVLESTRPLRMGVDQRDGDAELREPHPGAEELGTVLHQQRRDVAAAQAASAYAACAVRLACAFAAP